MAAAATAEEALRAVCAALVAARTNIVDLSTIMHDAHSKILTAVFAYATETGVPFRGRTELTELVRRLCRKRLMPGFSDEQMALSASAGKLLNMKEKDALEKVRRAEQNLLRLATKHNFDATGLPTDGDLGDATAHVGKMAAAGLRRETGSYVTSDESADEGAQGAAKRPKGLHVRACQ